MQTKLTLSIDKNVILRAKQYAEQQQQSVSNIVENYLDRISKPVVQSTSQKISAPITDGLVGMFAQDDEDQAKDYKKLLEEARLEKYL